MSKYQRITAVFLFFLMTTGICAAQSLEEVTKATNNLNIDALAKLQIERQSKGYQVRMDINVNNKNPQGLRLVNGDYSVMFNEQANINRMWEVGKTKIARETLESNAVTVVRLVMNEVPVENVIKMINIIGDPDAPRKVTLEGTSGVELQVGRGWGSEPDRRFKIELSWTPEFQRGVLMK